MHHLNSIEFGLWLAIETVQPHVQSPSGKLANGLIQAFYSNFSTLHPIL